MAKEGIKMGLILRTGGCASFLLVLLVLPVLSFSSAAWATFCDPLPNKELIKKYPIIFEGKVIKVDKEDYPIFYATHERPFTSVTFKVIEVYKGNIEDKIEAYIGRAPSGATTNPYKKDENYLFFGSKDKKTGLYDGGWCATLYNINDINKYPKNFIGAVNLITELASFKARLDALNNLIKKYPDIPSLLQKKGELLEDYKDHQRAAPVYKEAIAKKYQQWVKEKYGDKGPGGDLGKYNNLLDRPLEIPADALIHRMAGGWFPMLAYGRSLYYLENYNEAIKVFEMVNKINTNDEAKQLYLDSLTKINQQKALPKQPNGKK